MQKDSVHLDKPLAGPESRLEPVGCTWMNLPKGWSSKPIKEIGFTAPTYIPTDKLTPVYEVPAGYVIVPIEPTLDMVNAGRSRIQNKEYVGDIDMMLAYGAMITAAQSGINPKS